MDEDTEIATGVLIASVLIGVLSFIGFIIGIVAIVKTGKGVYKVLPWWGHLLFTLFLSPIELIVGSMEIHKMNQELSINHYHTRPNYGLSSDSQRTLFTID